MSIYTPPTDNTPIFDDAYFTTGDIPLTYNEAVKKFLRYPIAQGTENLLNVNISGTTAHTGKITQNLYGSSGTIADKNIQFGDSTSLASLTTGAGNIAIGYETLDAVTTGGDNIAIGLTAGSGITTGIRNIAIGAGAGNKITAVNGSVCIGYRAGFNTTTLGSNSIAIGNSAGFSTLNDSCVVLNASGATLNTLGGSRCYIKPIRNLTTHGNLLYYDSGSAEIIYSAPILNSGFPMTLALGTTDYGTTLNGNATYLGSYVTVVGATSAALTTSNTTLVTSITIPVGVSIISITEKLNITVAPTFTRMRRTLSTDGTIGSPATGTVILDQTSGPTAAHSFVHTNTFTVINSTGVAISGSYVVNFVFSAGSMTMQATATTIKIA